MRPARASFAESGQTSESGGGAATAGAQHWPSLVWAVSLWSSLSLVARVGALSMAFCGRVSPPSARQSIVSPSLFCLVLPLTLYHSHSRTLTAPGRVSAFGAPQEVDGEYVFNDGLKYVKSSWDYATSKVRTARAARTRGLVVALLMLARSPREIM